MAQGPGVQTCWSHVPLAPQKTPHCGLIIGTSLPSAVEMVMCGPRDPHIADWSQKDVVAGTTSCKVTVPRAPPPEPPFAPVPAPPLVPPVPAVPPPTPATPVVPAPPFLPARPCAPALPAPAPAVLPPCPPSGLRATPPQPTTPIAKAKQIPETSCKRIWPLQSKAHATDGRRLGANSSEERARILKFLRRPRARRQSPGA